MLGKSVGAGADLDEEAGARVAVDAQPHAHHGAVSVGLRARGLSKYPSGPLVAQNLVILQVLRNMPHSRSEYPTSTLARR